MSISIAAGLKHMDPDPHSFKGCRQQALDSNRKPCHRVRRALVRHAVKASPFLLNIQSNCMALRQKLPDAEQAENRTQIRKASPKPHT